MSAAMPAGARRNTARSSPAGDPATVAMENIYKPPDANLEKDRYALLVKTLFKQQSMLAGLLSAFSGSLSTLLALSFAGGFVPLYVFVVPGFVAGILVRLLGRPVTVLYRALPSLLAGLIVFIWLSLGSLQILDGLISLLNVLFCAAVSRRGLDYEERQALYRYRQGLIKL